MISGIIEDIDHVGSILKGLKFRIGATFFLLLGTGMILINIVMTMFWQRDMVRARIDQLSTTAAIAAEYIGSETSDVDRAIGHLVTHGGVECVLYTAGDGITVVVPKICELEEPLQSLADRAISTEAMQSGQIKSGINPLPFSDRRLLVAVPIHLKSDHPGAMAMMTTIHPLFKHFVANQKAVFLYILINVLILTALGLMRMVRVVIRPIERLARTSETYTDDEGFHFLSTTGDDEFRRLSTSINQMLKRIEADKSKLKTTVRSLQSANKKLQNTQQEMVRSEKLAAVGRLAAGLAHEIGNPVGIIQGYLDLMAEEDISHEDKKEYLVRTDKELQRIGGLIRKLLDFSRPDRQSPQQVSVHQLLTESLEMIQIRSKKESVKIVKRLNAENESVYADPDPLRQVFLNCLLNAFDAVVESEPEKRIIEISTRISDTDQISDTGQDDTANHFICIRMVDSGPGVSKADLPKVFDPFYTTKEPGKGTGLGLFVSHTIVENLGGRMALESKAEQGTAVIIELPLMQK